MHTVTIEPTRKPTVLRYEKDVGMDVDADSCTH